LQTEDISNYAIKLDKAQLKERVPTFPAIAAMATKETFQISKGLVMADIDSDQTKEYFRMCNSKEGVHLTIWSRGPLRGKCKWHSYYYLGYDMESDCTKKDYN
jgi:hypothetical protein